MGSNVEIVTRDDVLALRAEVLRPGFAPDAARFVEDDTLEAVHLAVRDAGTVVAVASLYVQASSHEATTAPWRLRGMATAPEVRGRGLGGALLAGVLDLVRHRNGTLLWCNARVSAAGFYERYGFVARGEVFETEVGPHRYMSRSW